MADREMVNVGCKMPRGIELHVMKRVPGGDPPMQDMGVITLAGYRPPSANPAPTAKTEAFTAVDKELFDIWFEENKSNSLVTSGVIFVQEQASDALAARDGAKVGPKPEPAAKAERSGREDGAKVSAER